jgi:hypothetical protein
MTRSLVRYKITVLPGDGIGPEVTSAAVRVLEVITKHTPLQLEITEQLFGGASIDAHGVPLSDGTLKACKEADAILLGTWRHEECVRLEGRVAGRCGGERKGKGEGRDMCEGKGTWARDGSAGLGWGWCRTGEWGR